MQETETMQEAEAKSMVFFFLFFTLTQIFTFQDRSGTDGFYLADALRQVSSSIFTPCALDICIFSKMAMIIFFFLWNSSPCSAAWDGGVFENTWTVGAPMPTPTPKKAPVSRIYCNKNTRQIGQKQNQTISKIQGAWLWYKPNLQRKKQKQKNTGNHQNTTQNWLRKRDSQHKKEANSGQKPWSNSRQEKDTTWERLPDKTGN